MALLDIHTSSLRLLSRQIDVCGGPLFSPQHLIHQCIGVMDCIQALDPSGKETFPLNENTKAYIEKLREQSKVRLESIPLSPKTEADIHTMRLVEIHCINIVHLENQRASGENNRKMADEILTDLIHEEQNNIDSLV